MFSECSLNVPWFSVLHFPEEVSEERRARRLGRAIATGRGMSSAQVLKP
jgi:hypothetical protein